MVSGGCVWCLGVLVLLLDRLAIADTLHLQQPGAQHTVRAALTIVIVIEKNLRTPSSGSPGPVEGSTWRVSTFVAMMCHLCFLTLPFLFQTCSLCPSRFLFCFSQLTPTCHAYYVEERHLFNPQLLHAVRPVSTASEARPRTSCNWQVLAPERPPRSSVTSRPSGTLGSFGSCFRRRLSVRQIVGLLTVLLSAAC